MKAATKSTQGGEPGESLQQVKQRFVQWRESRTRGQHISNALWAAAVSMVEQHGLQRTAKELRLDYDRLERRVEQSASSTQAGKAEPQFVEMFAPPAFNAKETCGCIVDMENARGGKMHIELKSLEGLAELSSAFWSAR